MGYNEEVMPRNTENPIHRVNPPQSDCQDAWEKYLTSVSMGIHTEMQKGQIPLGDGLG
jgi:hypothetical protein